MSGHYICRGCFNNFSRESAYSKGFCSKECRSIRKRNCANRVKQHGPFDVVNVVFKDGSSHRKRVCLTCGVGGAGAYLSSANTIKTKNLIKSEISWSAKFLKEKYGDKFYSSEKWRQLRYEAIRLYGSRCHCCRSEEGEIHVDHIKPRSKYPELEYDINNLQMLCVDCNLGKGNKDETDWRR